MGEYWKPGNVTKHEFIHPHRVGNGLKLQEWNHPASNVRRIMDARWAPTDDVRAVSDYGGLLQLSGQPSAEQVSYDDLGNYRDDEPDEKHEEAARFVMITSPGAREFGSHNCDTNTAPEAGLADTGSRGEGDETGRK